MKENIESKNIGNRKFIIELRYDPKVTVYAISVCRKRTLF